MGEQQLEWGLELELEWGLELELDRELKLKGQKPQAQVHLKHQDRGQFERIPDAEGGVRCAALQGDETPVCVLPLLPAAAGGTTLRQSVPRRVRRHAH